MVVKKPGAELTRDELLAFYDGKIAKWWTPDDVVFVDAIPLGATGKMQKNKLREQFADHGCRRPERAETGHDLALGRRRPGAGAQALFPGVLACAVVAAAATFLVASTTARR